MHYLFKPYGYREPLGCTCGPDSVMKRYGFDFVPDTVWGLSIRDACCIHDWMYQKGKTEADRQRADRTFLNNMLRTIEHETESWWLKWLRKRRAWVYYRAVSIFGGPNFWDGKRDPAELKESGMPASQRS